MRSVLASIKNRRTTSQAKLSKQNLKAFEDHLMSLPQSDSVSEWIALTNTMTGSNSAGSLSKKRKLLASTITSIAESGGHKYSNSYAETLYLLGITNVAGKGIIPSEHEHTELPGYFPEPNDLPLLSGYITSWFQTFKPNEASLVCFLREHLFPHKVSTSGENIVTILHEFSGPFKSHDLQELSRGNEGINFPIIKRHPYQQISNILQTPAAEDLRSRSDFVFAASTSIFSEALKSTFQFALVANVPCMSSNSPTCAVAVVTEVKANCSQTSFTAAKNQWSSLAYLQIMERVSISREKSYVGDENICQYGYVICGLQVIVWKMGLEWNRSKNRRSGILQSYFTFPVQKVAFYDLVIQEQLEAFVDTHKKILRWWLSGYLPSYIEDITNIAAKRDDPELWRTSWQQAVENFNPDSGDNPTIELLDASALGEQPAPPVGAETEGESLQQDDPDTHDDGICCGYTRHNTRCQKRVKNGKYCHLHQKE